MRPTRSALALAAAVAASAAAAAAPGAMWPLEANDLVRRLHANAAATLVEVVPAKGRDLAVVGAMRTVASDDRLVASVRRVQHLQQGRYFPTARRFSDPPVLEDLAALVLDETDLQDIRRCRPGDCGLKLSTPEIARLRQAVSLAGTGWRAAAQDEFRAILLARARAFLHGGFSGVPSSNDRKKPESPDLEFGAVLEGMGLEAVDEEMARYLRGYPGTAGNGVESFLYWSKETHTGAKPIIGITHVSMLRGREPGRPSVLVASAQVYATHYLTASLSVTAIAESAGRDARYLLYARRSRADVFDGVFGRLVRRMVEGRVRSEAPVALASLRSRLEAGDPPASASLR